MYMSLQAKDCSLPINSFSFFYVKNFYYNYSCTYLEKNKSQKCENSCIHDKTQKTMKVS